MLPSQHQCVIISMEYCQARKLICGSAFKVFIAVSLNRMKCPLASTNKRFLINTIKNTLPSHKEQDHEQKEGDKEPAKSQAQKEENPKKHRSHPYKHSFRARGSASYSPPRKRSSQDKYEKRSNRR
ncbi:DNA-directed RNA polymerases I and III subunit RPAC2 isoform X1 [Homo sapiens]|uniref:DNA-directed RNA polymerases I and III subunit RPAC2 isoform X1 n=1 Tax=Homo sapiens TaxID=9606 RepID=UPI00003E60A4|nr:Protein POLR1D isoform X1 [Homo sapiens]XP_054230571.1 Protein POLR1D isoform X1 [Homo sapiens]|eukprot:XP_016876111.1 Protein POLR1D isoform X2 [Homo sapiens]